MTIWTQSHDIIYCVASTLAVFGAGLDDVFPNKNKSLAEEILDKGGCLVSEYPIGSPVQKSRLIESTCLQAGLSDGVIVIETTEDGGSMHAVNTARHLKRAVAFCSYPHSHYEKFPQSVGNRDFIAGG